MSSNLSSALRKSKMAGESVDVCEKESGIKDEIGFGFAHEAFTDESEVLEVIEKIKLEYNDELALEMLDERFSVIIDKYQEQPHLLDPYLENLLAQLLTIASSSTTASPLMHQCFKFLYKITKVRGYKVIVRHLPHEVADLEPVLALLTRQNPREATWETRYMLLLWLSIIVMIPFHMTRLDSNISKDSNRKKPIIDRILDIGKFYLEVKDKPQDAAAYLLSRFVTRPDVKELHLQSFINWALDSVCAFDVTALSRNGELAVLALLFKHGKREDILTYAAHVLSSLLEKDFKSCNNTSLRKLSIKLTQRIGMTFLKPRVALWRYQRGSRSLESNLSAANLNEVSDADQSLNTCGGHEDEEDFDVPEEVESVLQELLNGLKDKETIIRWSAAKGVGRVTNRLPKELADEVVGSVLELFSSRETDSAWHGSCLALAELGRRGLLLPERLPDVVPVIIKALVFDEQKGSFSVGDHIRDAACYVCWAFARAYDPQEMRPYVTQIASALLITTVFDREIHCRRAASAAFQENVGRQGTFPHGIDIVTTADYFAVGNRNNAFLNLSAYIAEFPEYTLSLINHLVDRKINHWDATIRELAALALHGLTRKSPEYMTNQILPKLIPMATGLDLNTRHGSIFAIAEIIHSLTLSCEKSCHEIIGTSSVHGIKDIVPILQERKLFRGLGGELMKVAVSKLIEKAALSKLPFHTDTIIEIWQSLIDDCLRHGEIKALTNAISALTPFCSEYYCAENGKMAAQKQEWLINNYIHELQSTNENSRMGFCMGLGGLPAFMLVGKLSTIIPAIIDCTRVTAKDASWAKARKEAINALSTICCRLGIQSDGAENSALCSSHWNAILECFLEGLKDYTIDNCGDIGSYVRKAAMCGLQAVVGLIVKLDPSVISPDLSQRIICGIAQQAVEKIESVRACAGNVLCTFLHCVPEMPHIPHKEELMKLFPKSECIEIKWSRPEETFGRFTKMLSLPTYKYHLLLGFSMTAGGLTAHLIIDTMAAFSHYFQSLDKELRGQEITSISDTLVQIFQDNIGDPRVTIPLMKTIDQLLSSGHFDHILQEPEAAFGLKLFEIVKQELSQCADPNKIMAGLTVLCELLQCASICHNKVLGYFCIMLCHRYPRIRKDAASKMFTAVVSYENVVPDDSLDEVTSLLSETNWGGSVNDLRPIRNKLCDLLNIPRPKLVGKK